MKVRQTILDYLSLALKNMSYQRCLNKKINLLTYAVSILVISSTPAVAEDCQTMLQPYFDWGNQSSSDNAYPVYATLSIHSNHGASTGNDGGNANSVEYGHGRVTSKAETSYLLGSVAAYVNWATPPFKSLPQLTYSLKVNKTGEVSVGTLVNNRPFLNRPPVVFQGSCSNKLITGFVDGKSYVVSFRNRPKYAIIK